MRERLKTCWRDDKCVEVKLCKKLNIAYGEQVRKKNAWHQNHCLQDLEHQNAHRLGWDSGEVLRWIKKASLQKKQVDAQLKEFFLISDFADLPNRQNRKF